LTFAKTLQRSGKKGELALVETPAEFALNRSDFRDDFAQTMFINHRGYRTGIKGLFTGAAFHATKGQTTRRAKAAALSSG